MVAASKAGSNARATAITACSKPSTAAPITLMGNALGYSIRLGSACIASASDRHRLLGLLVGLVQAAIDRAWLAAQGAVADRFAIKARDRQDFLRRRAQQHFVSGQHVGFGNGAQV